MLMKSAARRPREPARDRHRGALRRRGVRGGAARDRRDGRARSWPSASARASRSSSESPEGRAARHRLRRRRHLPGGRGHGRRAAATRGRGPLPVEGRGQEPHHGGRPRAAAPQPQELGLLGDVQGPGRRDARGFARQERVGRRAARQPAAAGAGGQPRQPDRTARGRQPHGPARARWCASTPWRRAARRATTWASAWSAIPRRRRRSSCAASTAAGTDGAAFCHPSGGARADRPRLARGGRPCAGRAARAEGGRDRRCRDLLAARTCCAPCVCGRAPRCGARRTRSRRCWRTATACADCPPRRCGRGSTPPPACSR